MFICTVRAPADVVRGQPPRHCVFCVFAECLLLMGLSPAPSAAATILNETFESGFPTGKWAVFGEPTWDDDDVSSWSSHSHAAWCGGSSLDPDGFYINGMDAFMAYGPFSLADAQAAALTYEYYLWMGDNGDFMHLYVSTDGQNYSEVASGTGFSIVWLTHSVDFSNIPGLGSLLGQPNVWVGFRFTSNDAMVSYGAYVDNVKIEKTVAAAADLVALEVYFRDQPEGQGNIINTPCVGQAVYPHFRYRLDGATGSVANVPLRIEMDGTVLCSGQLTVDPGENTGWCSGPWTVTAGNHTLKGVINTGGVIQESNPDNNQITKAFTSCTAGPDIRVEPMSLNITCASPSGIPGTALADDVSESTMVPMLPPAPADKVVDRQEILQAFAHGETRVKVIVNLIAPPAAPRQVNWNQAQSVKPLRDTIRAHQDAVLAGLNPQDYGVRHRLENQPTFSAEVAQAALAALENHPDVHSIELVRPIHFFTRQGIPLIGGTTHRSTHNGTGVAVAIVDTGIDYTHPMLGGGAFPNTKVIGGRDFGNNDADPRPGTEDPSLMHGTGCAGIAAGSLGNTGDYIGGVAYNAKIYALRVDGMAQGWMDAGLASLDWCVTHKNDNPNNPILVCSNSWGLHNTPFTNTCDSFSAAMTTAINNAVSAGITVLFASGNDGFCSATSFPSCISNALSVGAVYDASFGNYMNCVDPNSCVGTPNNLCLDPANPKLFTDATTADRVTSYSNAASYLDILAPSHNAYTPDIVGTGGLNPEGDYYDSFGGTSAACPYGAGAVAALQSAAKAVQGSYLTPAQVQAILTSTGDPVTDPKSGITKPRVNLAAAIHSLGSSEPNCFTLHNDGSSTLQVTAIDRPAWATLSPPLPYSIPAGGSQQVCVDACGGCAGSNLQGTLVIHSNDPDEATVSVGVQVQCPNCAAPIIAEIPDHSTPAGTTYSRTPSLTQGTTPVTWSLVVGPSGMTIDPNTGAVSWPSPVDGPHNITARAANTCGSDDESWVLTVSSGPLRTVSLVCGAPTTTVTVTVALTSLGDENAFGFSINYDSMLLTYASAVAGSDSPPGTVLIPNSSQPGKLGLLVGLPFGQTFQTGNRNVAVVTFSLVGACSVPSTEVSFGDQPIFREVTDALANALTVSAWQPCSIICCSGPEADVAPRASTGNGNLTTADWTQMGRFVAGLDAAHPGCEFQKADVAPRPCGNGALTTADWTQGGRYVAGLDPAAAPACGPIQPASGTTPTWPQADSHALSVRAVRVVCTVIRDGQTGYVKIALDAQGDENALGFSVSYDPAILAFKEARLCGGDLSLALLVSPSPAQGRVGILIGKPPGQAFAASTTCLVEICFQAVGASGTMTDVAFCDQPVFREVVDATANTLSTSFQDGRVQIGDPVRFDFDIDTDVDLHDLAVFDKCATGPHILGPSTPECSAGQFAASDADGDGDVDQADFSVFQRCYSGEDTPAAPQCE